MKSLNIRSGRNGVSDLEQEKEKPNFWKYLKGKLWIILAVNVFVLVYPLSNSLGNINDLSVRLSAYAGIILGNIIWIGIYYFHYRMKVKEYKKLLKEIKKKWNAYIVIKK